MTVRDKDRGYAALMASIDKSGSYRITVGIHAEDGGQYANGVTLAEVAEKNEFGGPNQPARPFIGPWADERRASAIEQIKAAFKEALKARTSPAQRLDQIAQVLAGEVQQRISTGIPPPNAQSTIDRKGSSTPLIDTGQLRGSIRGKVSAK